MSTAWLQLQPQKHTAERIVSVQISRAADDLLRKKATYDGLKPAVDLEDETLVSRIFEMLAGSPRESVGGVAAAAPVAQKLPVAPALRVKLYRLCCKSVTSCNMMPHTLKVNHTYGFLFIAILRHLNGFSVCMHVLHVCR